MPERHYYITGIVEDSPASVPRGSRSVWGAFPRAWLYTAGLPLALAALGYLGIAPLWQPLYASGWLAISFLCCLGLAREWIRQHESDTEITREGLRKLLSWILGAFAALSVLVGVAFSLRAIFSGGHASQSLLDVRISGDPDNPDQVFGTVQYFGPGKADDLCIWYFPFPRIFPPTQRLHVNQSEDVTITERFTLWFGNVQRTGSMGSYERQLFHLPTWQPTVPLTDVYIYTSYLSPDGTRLTDEHAFVASGRFFTPEALSELPLTAEELRRASEKICKPLR
jgi:hypothetical protein